MLTEEEKQRIQLEETYRNEVQKELSTDKKSGFLTFLNSNFGAFILSTVIVGGFSFLYNQHRDKLEKQQITLIKQQQRLDYQRDLRNELVHRLEVIETINDTLYDFQFVDFQLAYWGTTIANDPKIKAQYFNFKSFNEKYDKWSLIRIVDELYLVENDSTHLLIENLRNELNKNYNTVKFLGEQWQDITATGKLLGKGKLDLRQGLYLKRGSNNIPVSRTEIPLNRVWINSNKEHTNSLIKIINKAKLSLTMYKRH
jgi:hypothetical protein